MVKKILVFCLIVFVFIFSVNSGFAYGLSGEDLMIQINLPSFSLILIKNGEVLKEYRIAVGKPATPTPLGNYLVINKVINPTWYPPWGGSSVPSGPSNPLGYRWIGFRKDGYGIHGTNNPSSISKAISHGCIRMYNKDVEELFKLIPTSIPVKINYETIEIEELEYGKIRLTIYPDIYKQGSNLLSNIKKRLERLGYLNRFSLRELDDLINKAKSQPVSMVKGYNLYQENDIIAENCLKQDGEILVPLSEVENILKKSFYQDQDNKQFFLGETMIPQPLYIENNGFIRSADLERLFGLIVLGDGQIKTKEVSSSSVYSSNGKKIKNFIVQDNEVLIPLTELSFLLPLGIVYYPDRKIVKLDGNMELKYILVNQIRYLKIEEINLALGTNFVYRSK